VYASDRFKWNEVPPFFIFKRFILFDNSANKYKVFQLENEKINLSVMNEDVGQALLVRRKDFMHM